MEKVTFPNETERLRLNPSLAKDWRRATFLWVLTTKPGHVQTILRCFKTMTSPHTHYVFLHWFSWSLIWWSYCLQADGVAYKCAKTFPREKVYSRRFSFERSQCCRWWKRSYLVCRKQPSWWCLTNNGLTSMISLVSIGWELFLSMREYFMCIGSRFTTRGRDLAPL